MVWCTFRKTSLGSFLMPLQRLQARHWWNAFSQDLISLTTWLVYCWDSDRSELHSCLTSNACFIRWGFLLNSMTYSDSCGGLRSMLKMTPSNVECTHISLVQAAPQQLWRMPCRRQLMTMWQTLVLMQWRPSKHAFMLMTASNLLHLSIREYGYQLCWERWPKEVGLGWPSGLATVKSWWVPSPNQNGPKIWRMSISSPCHLRRHLVSLGVLKLTLSVFVSSPQRNLLQDEVSCWHCHHDPLGMAVPYVLTGKSIVQDCCRLKLTWDECVPDDLCERWRSWVRELSVLDNFCFDRCYKPESFWPLKFAQLHHFTDASQFGYGCVSYLWLVDVDGCVHCAIVFGKSRVASLKPVTIPRMELTAAVVAARVDAQLRAELTLPLEVSQFWTDSISVLGYVKNERARFNIFVGNRVAVIHELSASSQWYCVPSHTNPVDHALRGLNAESLVNDQSSCGRQRKSGLNNQILIPFQKETLRWRRRSVQL